MEIKRGAFLVLTAAIAQVGCTVIQNTNTGGAGGATTTGGSGGSGGSAGTAQGGQATAGTAGSTAGEGGASMGGAAGSTASEGGASMGGAAGSTATGGAGGSATGGAGGASSCDDSVGTPGNCADLDGVPNCSGGYEQGFCNAAVTNFKPKVAESAAGCILQITDCATTSVDVYGCLRTALAGACPDSNAETDAICSMAGSSTYCTTTTEPGACHAIVDGLGTAGLAAVHTCVESGPTTCASLWFCIESL